MLKGVWRKYVQRAPLVQAPAGTFVTQFTPRIESFGEVHVAIDHDLANLAMVQVGGGFVAIDAGSSLDIGGRVAAEWQRLANGPLRALILTHSHPDHICGAAAFVDGSDGVPIWAHRRFIEELGDTQLLPNAFYIRGAKQFGYGIDKELVTSNGIGPPLRMDAGVRPPLRLPTHTFDDRAEFDFGGTTFELHWAPGETYDHLFVWLPRQRVLFAGDNLYKSFPNLYSLRGVSPRPVRGWIDSLDVMRRLQPRPELMILGHTAPVVGPDAIHALLTAYRDAIAWVHDSVVRGLNEGKSPDRLAREIRLPSHLASHPYLAEHYGTVAASVRGICTGYLGWFDGDAANLDPPTCQEIAAWLADELGDRQQLAARIDRALASRELRKALWLSQLLEANAPGWSRGKQLKSTVLEQLASDADNPLVRNWLLSDAAVLRNRFRLPRKPPINGATIEELPMEMLLRLIPSRVNPRTTAGVRTAIGFDLIDSGRKYTLLIRHGVGELAPGLVESPQLVVRGTERDLKRMFLASDVAPVRREFWNSLKFDVPEQDAATPLRRLIRLARVSRLFIRP